MFKISKTIFLFLMVLAMFANTGVLNAEAQSTVDDMSFIADVTIPDGTVVKPNEQFVKTWRIMNTGKSFWSPQFTFGFAEGDLMSATPTVQNLIANVDVKNTIDLSVTMTAPAQNGVYKGFWQMKNAQGVAFGPKIWVSITVSNGTYIDPSVITGTTSHTPTPQNFQYREVSANVVEIYYEGTWNRLTAQPENNYKLLGVPGTIDVYEYQDCSSVWSWEAYWWVQKCETKFRSIYETGLLPAVSISKEGEIAFYSYINTLTFGMVGTVYGGTLTGINGYTITRIGTASSVKAASVTAAFAKFSVPVLVVSYLIYAGNVFVVTYPITPVPVPVAPTTIVMEIPANYVADLTPITGSSSGQVDGKYSGHAWVILSLPHFCSLWMDSSMPKSDWSQLLKFSEEEKLDRPCNVFDILKLMLKIGKRATEAGVSVEFIRSFYLEVLSKIVIDLKLPIPGDAIIKMLGL